MNEFHVTISPRQNDKVEKTYLWCLQPTSSAVLPCQDLMPSPWSYPVTSHLLVRTEPAFEEDPINSCTLLYKLLRRLQMFFYWEVLILLTEDKIEDCICSGLNSVSQKFMSPQNLKL